MGVKFVDNTRAALSALKTQKRKALEAIGIVAEGYAAALCPVGTVESTGIAGYRGGTLRQSITHRVEDDVVRIGSNVEYAPYVELGTGPHFEPPPSWETFESERGSGVGRSYVKPRPYIRPAIENHVGEYRQIIETELSR